MEAAQHLYSRIILSAVSPDWKSKVGKGKSVNWPVGLGGKGNEGVSGLLSQNPYSIGYIELAYAKLQDIPYAYIKNKAGKFIEPTLETTASAAAGAVPTLPAGDASWSSVSIVDACGDNSYPIGSFTYLLVYKDQVDQTKGKLLAEFLWWAVHDGQKYSSELLYVPLPDEVISLNEKTIRLMNYKGQPLIIRMDRKAKLSFFVSPGENSPGILFLKLWSDSLLLA